MDGGEDAGRMRSGGEAGETPTDTEMRLKFIKKYHLRGYCSKCLTANDHVNSSNIPQRRQNTLFTAIGDIYLKQFVLKTRYRCKSSVFSKHVVELLVCSFWLV